MISLLMKLQKETFIITIEGKTVRYWDRLHGKLWGGPIQYLPKDPAARNIIIASRNKIPYFYLKLLDIPDSEFKEWEDAKDEEEVCRIILIDAKKNGCVVLKEERK
jgi:hypothetical protein